MLFIFTEHEDILRENYKSSINIYWKVMTAFEGKLVSISVALGYHLPAPYSKLYQKTLYFIILVLGFRWRCRFLSKEANCTISRTPLIHINLKKQMFPTHLGYGIKVWAHVGRPLALLCASPITRSMIPSRRVKARLSFIKYQFTDSFEDSVCMYTRQKKFCTLGSFGEFYLNLECMHLMLYRCLEKSFCTILRNSKPISVAHQRNTPHLKDLGLTPQKLQNDQ